MGKKLGDKAPKIFNVNWFRTDDEGHFIWPGFGDNLRVLEWIMKRCDGKADAVETPIGYVPKAEDIDLEDAGRGPGHPQGPAGGGPGPLAGGGRRYPRPSISKFGNKLPQELSDSLEKLEARLAE